MPVTVEVLPSADLEWDAGVPAPVLLSSELQTLLAFQHRDGTATIVELVGCTSVKFGFPNDEAQHGHPLWKAGFEYYAVHVVHDSPWLRELRETESVHPRAPKTPFPEDKHYALTFHDSMLEAIARDIQVVPELRASRRSCPSW